MVDDTITLGGNIELTGFKEVDPRSMVILKKIIGNYVRKFSDHYKGFKGIKIVLKTIGSDQYELKAALEMEKGSANVEQTGRNIFEAVDSLLKHAEKALEKG